MHSGKGDIHTTRAGPIFNWIGTPPKVTTLPLRDIEKHCNPTYFCGRHMRSVSVEVLLEEGNPYLCHLWACSRLSSIFRISRLSQLAKCEVITDPWVRWLALQILLKLSPKRTQNVWLDRKLCTQPNTSSETLSMKSCLHWILLFMPSSAFDKSIKHTFMPYPSCTALPCW